MEIAKTIFHPDGSRKVEIRRNSDGTFGFEEWKWLTEENSWCPISKGRSIAVVDTMSHVLEEIKGRIDWVDDSVLALNLAPAPNFMHNKWLGYRPRWVQYFESFVGPQHL